MRRLSKHEGYDLAFVPGDNRYSWLAQALGSKWIIGFGGHSSWHKNLFIDEFRRWPSEAMALGDVFATLAEGPAPEPYTTEQWRTPPCKLFEIPTKPFVVFHMGASSPLKLWPYDQWNALAKKIEALGFEVVFTPGKGEMPLVDEIDPESHYQRPDLDLAQMFNLLRETELVISPDTGIAHLARVSGAPSITLFGPGSSTAFEPGNFRRNASWRSIDENPFPCRDQHKIFGRNSPNISRCYRSANECPQAKCMDAISVDSVIDACKSMLRREPNMIDRNA